ncbi:MAG: hypothetical protein GY951_11615 [Psychromonas sp.]|nr:hypothetical protein [Alteromonadales bacterium]MCP5078687.1 hypothetical protein [Psychromonas sp.]
MICIAIKSDNGHREGGWIGLIIALILLLAYLLLPYHQQQFESSELAEQQVSVKQLKKTQLAMLTQLRLAHQEIRYLFLQKRKKQLSQRWPTIVELQNEWLTPFTQDRQWQMLGKPQWMMISDGVYQATSQQGLSVVLDSRGIVAKVWFDQQQQVTHFSSPTDQLTDLQLIENGWWLVVDNINHNHEH